jgi:NADPH:quinone reductase-like Zn-dependent oxidoreductase
MALPATMAALLLKGDGYAREAPTGPLETLEPYLEAGTVAVPQPAPSQVLIKVGLSSINPSDIAFIKGVYGQPRKKGQPAGFEGVGEVVAAGADAAAQALLGKRVAFATGTSNWGSWAEYAVTEAAAAIPLFRPIRDEDAAAMIVNPLTAVAMFDMVRQEGEKSFILSAGASQLSKLIMGIARDAGFRPIAVVRRDDQAALLKRAGAQHVLNEKASDFGAALRELLKVEPARIFLDAVTGAVASTIFTAMPKGARWIIYGRLDPAPTTINEPGQLIFAGKRIEGFWLVDWMRKAGDRRVQAVMEVQKRFSDGRWSTDVTSVVPLSQAMARVPTELARPNGKVFIKP